MMWGHYDEFSWWWFVIMPLGMLAFWAAVAWVIVMVVRNNRSAVTPAIDPERILAERYARGDIDRDEYQQRLDDLRAHHTPGGPKAR